ncbi:class I SAM-dependent methyltransferase [Lysobacter korlensis]|uniref:Class I SAM-dependent methyltransferase n=1 Tax=Lysobacter korlensis TaxID=553636 RepID=A0ABV6RVP2_9GAMM
MVDSSDGSAGDTDYGRVGAAYSEHRRPEPEIADAILAALGGARRVLNVGAGAGSYEPADRDVVAVEPSAAMRAQRPPHLTPAVDATAEHLPFGDDEFDAAMATFTVHQWADLEAGLTELRRVTRGPVVLLTADPSLLERYWLVEYLPEVIRTEEQRFPTRERIAAALGGGVRVEEVPIPLHCRDGFGEAYYGRPELLLDKSVQQAMSAFSHVSPDSIERFERNLRSDLDSGRWDERHGRLRSRSHFRGSLILIIAD